LFNQCTFCDEKAEVRIKIINNGIINNIFFCKKHIKKARLLKERYVSREYNFYPICFSDSDLKLVNLNLEKENVKDNINM